LGELIEQGPKHLHQAERSEDEGVHRRRIWLGAFKDQPTNKHAHRDETTCIPEQVEK
jgi:hypothetical protein